jgi:hypothetical protein
MKLTQAEESRVLANRILDRPNADPDDDLATLSRELLRADEKVVELRTVLALALDAVDYENGACRLNEMVGAVLPKEILARMRAAVKT